MIRPREHHCETAPVLIRFVVCLASQRHPGMPADLPIRLAIYETRAELQIKRNTRPAQIVIAHKRTAQAQPERRSAVEHCRRVCEFADTVFPEIKIDLSGRQVVQGIRQRGSELLGQRPSERSHFSPEFAQAAVKSQLRQRGQGEPKVLQAGTQTMSASFSLTSLSASSSRSAATISGSTSY